MKAIQAITYHSEFTFKNAEKVSKALIEFEKNFVGNEDEFAEALVKAIPVPKPTPESTYSEKLMNGPKIVPSLLRKGISLHTLYQVNPILAGHLFLREVAIRLDQAYPGNIKNHTTLYGIGEVFDRVHTYTNTSSSILPWLLSNVGFFRDKQYAEIALKHWYIIEGFMKRKESSKGNILCDMYGFKS